MNKAIESGTKNYFLWGLILSLLSHSLLLSIIRTRPVIPERMTVSLNLIEVEPETRASRQIVSPPDNSDSVPVPDTKRYLSDKDSSAVKESIKRGIEDAGIPLPHGPITPPQEQRKVKPQPKTAPRANRNRKNLKLSDEGLLAKYSAADQKKEEANQDLVLDSPREFSRAAGTGAAFYGTRGVPDYLPHLPDGDLTLLNTKASRFAVFVRRVATRVFGQMRQAGWDYLRSGDIHQIMGMVTVDAVLNVKGELISVSIINSSGSSKFDEVLLGAVKKGVEDKNPPPAAVASDGNIHFIFKSRSWSRPTVSRGGAPGEQRWLLLGTGLQ